MNPTPEGSNVAMRISLQRGHIRPLRGRRNAYCDCPRQRPETIYIRPFQGRVWAVMKLRLQVLDLLV